MVRVNNKPQYLVFCWYFAHLLSKHRCLPVESCKRPCLARGCAVCFALKSGQNPGPCPIPVPQSKRSPLQAPSQGAGLVQNGASPVRIVEIGDPFPSPTSGCWEFHAGGVVDAATKSAESSKGPAALGSPMESTKMFVFWLPKKAKCSLGSDRLTRLRWSGISRFFEAN
jgi:hypothetical protein